jgi:hypothetical protein
MARQDPAILSFNAGELSPLLHDRTDFDKRASGCDTLINFIPSVQGPIRRRPGTQYMGVPAVNDADVVLIPFEANTGASFILEVGGGYTRFWNAGAPQRIQVRDNAGTWNIYGAGGPASLATPWALNDLYDADRICKLQWVQSNDVMWIVHPDYAPVKISRISQYQFTWAFFGDNVNVPMPFQDDQLTSTTCYASAATGVGITLTFSVANVQPVVGSWLLLRSPSADGIKAWEPGKSITAGDRRRSDGRNYTALNTATSGSVKPTHTTGAKFDGDTGVQWNYTDDGYGIVAITANPTTTTSTATVVKTLPAEVVGSGNASTRWAYAAWYGSFGVSGPGWPNAIAFHRERLCFARGQTLWTSVAGDFENFLALDGGVISDDMAITLTIAAEKNDRILAMRSKGALLCLTASGEYAISELDGGSPFGPGNVQARRQSGYGCIGMVPIDAGEATLFAQRGGARLREMIWDDSLAGYKANDLTVQAEHLTYPSGIRQAAFARYPDPIIWCLRRDFVLVGMTYSREHQVAAWHRHELGGRYGGSQNYPAWVKAIAVGSSPDGVSDDLWMVVNRTVDGANYTSIEVLGAHWALNSFFSPYYYHDIPETREACYLDAAKPFLITAGATAIGGVPHLNGMTAQALVEGQVNPPAVVSGGSIPVTAHPDLRWSWIGLPYNSDYKSLPIQGGSSTGSPQGKIARIMGMVTRVYKSVNYRFGMSATDRLDRDEFRTQSDAMDEATPLFTGDRFTRFPGGYTEQARIFIRADQPLPLTITSIYPKLTVEDSR